MPKVTKVFESKFLVEELDLPEAAVLDNVVDTDRWNTLHEMVFKHEGKHYKTSYRVGSTEIQDEGPWEYEKEVTCTEVELREVKVMRWLPVNG